MAKLKEEIIITRSVAEAILKYTKVMENEIATEWGQSWAYDDDMPEFYHFLKKELEVN